MSVATAICAMLTLPVWVRDPTPLRHRTPVDIATSAWLAALLLSAWFAVDRVASLARVPKGLFPLLVTLAAFHARDPRWGRRALAALLISALVAALFGLGVFVAHGASPGLRARGAVGHYMTFAGQLLLASSLAAAVALGSRTRAWRVLGAGLALSGTLALAATLTRSAWLGFATALAVVLGGLRPRWLPVAAALAALALLLAPASYRARALSIVDPRDPTNLERTYMWEAGLRMFRDRPLTGVGLQDMKAVYDRYRSPGATERAGHLHSVPVQIGASMGLAGLAAFALLYGGLLRAACAGLGAQLRAGGLAAGVRLGVAAGLVGFLVAGLFEWNFGDEELLYPLCTLAGIAWAARDWPADRPTPESAVPGPEPGALTPEGAR